MDILLRDMIRQMNVSLRNMKFYAGDHPTTMASVQKSYDALTQTLQQKGELVLGVVENTLIVGDSPVEESDTFIARFTEELNVRNIGSLVFYPDISQEEFRAFLNCLTIEPDRVMAEGGVQRFFDTQGISHVLANEVKYGKIGEGSGDGTEMEDAVVAAFLMGKMPVFRGDQEGFLSLLQDNPAKIGEMINSAFSEMKQRGEEEEKSARAVNRAVDQVGRFLEGQPGGPDEHGNVMAQIILSLNPEAQAALYGFRAAQGESPEDRIDASVMEFTDEEVIRLICNVYRGGLRSPEVLARMVRRVLSDAERRMRVASDLGQELMKLGMEREAWETLRDDILWDVYSLTQKVDRLASRAQLTKGDLERIKRIGPDLAGKSNAPEIRKLLTSLIAALGGQDSEVRGIVAGYLHQFYDIVDDSGKFTRVDLFFCQKLITRLKREPDESVRASILKSLASILKKEILKERFNAAARAILTLSKTGHLEKLIDGADSLVSQDVGDHLITALSGEDETRRNEALTLLKLFGRAVLESVLFAMEREEKPDTRKRLMAVVKSMGSGVTGEIIERLADTRWYVVQTALYVLGEIGDKSISPGILTSSVYHNDIRVRKEAIKTLGKLRSRGANRVLCELLEEKNEEIRLLVLRTLGEVGDKMAVPHIIPFLQKKMLKTQKSDILRQAAIDALGRIGDPEAIPTLIDLLKGRGVFRKEDGAIRKSAVEALGTVGVAELEEGFQSIIEKDPDVDVREAARRAVLNLKTPQKRAAL